MNVVIRLSGHMRRLVMAALIEAVEEGGHYLAVDGARLGNGELARSEAGREAFDGVCGGC